MVRHFAGTWWGKAWIDALESRARLDPNRLARGRTYARQGRVMNMAVEPGEVSALVRGSRRQPYEVVIEVREFTDGEWERVLGAIVGRAVHVAALLDGEMDPGIVEDAKQAGVDLFPTAGDLVPYCSCPDWADPCKHSAAVCYLVADMVDADPFDLFLLRGRGRDEIINDLRALRSAGASSDAPAATARRGSVMAAKDAWARTIGTLPPIPHPQRNSGRLAPWPTDPPARSGLDGEGLVWLAADAVARARLMVTGEGDSGLGLSASADLARRAEATLGTSQWDDLVSRSGVEGRELETRALAWRFGGVAGLKVISEMPWTPNRRTMEEAKWRIESAGVSGRLSFSRNAIFWGDTSVRLAHDGRWWPFIKRAGRWYLSGRPSPDADDHVNPEP